MTSRLSSVELKKKYDTGFHHLQRAKRNALSEISVLDLEGLLARPDRAEVIATIPSQQLYFALKSEGLAEHRAILQYLTSEQLTRILDYDCWPDSKLERKNALQWLMPFHEFGPAALAKAYQGLDEEYQIAMLQGLVRIYDEEEVEKLPLDVRDGLFPFPGHQLFYDILSEDNDDVAFVQTLMDSAQTANMAYALSLLQHATYDVPNEPEFQLTQFRVARLEEDGFVSKEEARETFLPINIEAMQSRWNAYASTYKTSSESEGLTPTVDSDTQPFIYKVRQQAVDFWDLNIALDVHQRLVLLANNICAACEIEPSETEELREVFDHAQGLVSLGLEFASQKDVVKGAGILAAEQPKVLLRTGVTLAQLVRNKIITSLKNRGFDFADKIQKLANEGRFGQIQWVLDTECFSVLGFEITEELKGLFNRFPMHAVRNPESGRFSFEIIGTLERLNQTAEELDSKILKLNLHN